MNVGTTGEGADGSVAGSSFRRRRRQDLEKTARVESKRMPFGPKGINIVIKNYAREFSSAIAIPVHLVHAIALRSEQVH